jgi:cytochrome b561
VRRLSVRRIGAPLIASWPAPLRWLHWASAALVAATIPAAFLAQALIEARTDTAEALISAHILAGLAILVLTLGRLSLRLVLPRPDPLARPAWIRAAAAARSILLYALLLALPVTGILKLTLSGFEIAPFGIVLIQAGPAVLPVAQALDLAHAILGWTLIAVALLHAAAALHGRRAMMARMWPRAAPPPS